MLQSQFFCIIMQAKNGSGDVISGSGCEFGINSNGDTKLASASCVYKEDPDFSNMTEDEQIEHAMQTSMQENERTKNKNEENYLHVINNSAFLHFFSAASFQLAKAALM